MEGVKRVKKEKIIYNEMKKKIIRMEIIKGKKINEKELKEKYGVRRKKVREELIRIEEDSMVDVLKK